MKKNNNKDEASERELHTDEKRQPTCVKLDPEDIEAIAGGTKQDEPIELPEI